MDEHRFPLSQYAASLVEPKDGQSRFETLEAIRAPYRKRAKMLALARAIALIVFGAVTILTAIRYALAPGISAFAPLSAAALSLAVYLSPKFYKQLGVDRGLPPHPSKFRQLFKKLGHGDFRSTANTMAVPSSHYLSPFAILLTSDIDDDWALVPDHRLRILKHPVELDFKSLEIALARTSEAFANTGDDAAAKLAASEETTDQTLSHAGANQQAQKSQRKNSADWLRSLTWRQMKYNLPTALDAETRNKGKRLRISLALRHGRAALRGHTKHDMGLVGAIKAAVEAIERATDETGNKLKVGLNETDSSEWIKQLLLGTYGSGRIKDCLQGKPQLPLCHPTDDEK